MERIDLMVGNGANRLRLRRLSSHRPDGESRRVPDNRMLWTGTALMRFADFPTINSVLSNAAELRYQSRHVFGSPLENRPPMPRRDVAS
jgi:acyl carrier protein phosphodiesterase